MIEHRNIIRYGVAALLREVSDWLDELVPHRPGTPWSKG